MIAKRIQDSLSQFGIVAVAVSGGADSMALLHWFIHNQNTHQTDFFAVHVEHGIRGEASLKDAAFVQDFCRKNGVECRVFSVDALKEAAAKNCSQETAARSLRHHIFETLVQQKACDKVVTAHHLDDQAESILMHIFRGTGLFGLKGMQFQERYLLRPLIETGRAEIDAYIEKNQIEFRTDATNTDTRYTRNYVRHEIIPKIEVRFPAFKKSLAGLSDAAAEMLDFGERAAPMAEFLDGHTVRMPLGDDLHPARIKLGVRCALEMLDIYADIEKSHYEAVLALLTAENGKYITLPAGISVYKEYDAFVFQKALQTSVAAVQRFQKGAFEFAGMQFCVQEVTEFTHQAGTLFFDADKIPKNAVIRARAKGDRFRPFGGGEKSLGDWMTDKKIPARLRESIPLIASGSKILIVAGYEISDCVRVGEETKKIYALQKRR